MLKHMYSKMRHFCIGVRCMRTRNPLQGSTRHVADLPYLNHASLLTSDEVSIADATAEFAKIELAPRVIKDFSHEGFDKGIMRAMGQQGLLGISSDGYDCTGASTVAYGLAAREIERIDSGYRSAMSVQSSLVIHPIVKFGSIELKEAFLPKLCKGDLVGCFALTESNAGSDPSNMRTIAIRDGDDYLINGEKMWITNAPIADVVIVWAKIQSSKFHITNNTLSSAVSMKETDNIVGFVIDTKSPGVTITKIENKLSLRASLTGSIQFNNVRVPVSNVLSNGKCTLADAFDCLHKARYGIAFGVLGAAEDCFNTAREYASQRRQFGDALIQKQLVQRKLADMYTDISLSLLGCIQTGRLMDESESASSTAAQVSMLKRRSCKIAIRAALQARDILGGNGITLDYSPLRHAINLQTVNTYEGTADIHALIIGRHISGLSGF